jgi:hypothetical protein
LCGTDYATESTNKFAFSVGGDSLNIAGFKLGETGRTRGRVCVIDLTTSTTEPCLLDGLAIGPTLCTKVSGRYTGLECQYPASIFFAAFVASVPVVTTNVHLDLFPFPSPFYSLIFAHYRVAVKPPAALFSRKIQLVT